MGPTMAQTHALMEQVGILHQVGIRVVLIHGGGPHGQGGLDTDCVCPSCGFQERHVPGRPCRQRKCPKCGHFLQRVEPESGEGSGTDASEPNGD